MICLIGTTAILAPVSQIIGILRIGLIGTIGILVICLIEITVIPATPEIETVHATIVTQGTIGILVICLIRTTEILVTPILEIGILVIPALAIPVTDRTTETLGSPRPQWSREITEILETGSRTRDIQTSATQTRGAPPKELDREHKAALHLNNRVRDLQINNRAKEELLPKTDSGLTPTRKDSLEPNRPHIAMHPRVPKALRETRAREANNNRVQQDARHHQEQSNSREQRSP